MASLGTTLTNISYSINAQPDDVKRLGRELGLDRTEIKKYKKDKNVIQKGKYTREGTKEMLEDWAKGREEDKVVDDLRAALEKAGLQQVVEQCLGDVEPASAQPADETNGATETAADIQEISLDDNKDILRKVATTISEKDAKKAVRRLGKQLGYKSKYIKKYIQANRADGETNAEGAMEMLLSWSKDIPSDRMPKDLKAALTRANLEWVADRCIPVDRSADDTASDSRLQDSGEKSSFPRPLTPTGSSQRSRNNVAICSGSSRSSVKGLLEYIDRDMRDVVKCASFKQLPYNIREMNHTSLKGIKVMVLCHSIDNRRFSITDVTDSLYDKFLKKARKKLGRRRVCVIVHDLSSADIEPATLEARMDSFRATQPTTFKHSSLVMIAGDLSKHAPELNDDQRRKLNMFFEQAGSQRACWG